MAHAEVPIDGELTVAHSTVDLPRLDADVTDTDLAAALDHAGCCVIESLMSAPVMDAIANELGVYQPKASIGASNFEGHQTRRLGSPLPRSATFRSIAMHPAIIAAGAHVLGHASGWRYSAAEYIEIGPGETPQQLHRDQWKYDMVDFDVEVELNGMWAITDFTERNGATRIAPGSHRFGNRERLNAAHTVAATMPKGSLLLYTGSTYHGGGLNESDAWRSGLSLQHAVSWLTQSTNQFLECPPDVVTDWPEELVRFIGYDRAGNGLGYWRDSEDPMAAVHPDRDYSRGWATVRTD